MCNALSKYWLQREIAIIRFSPLRNDPEGLQETEGEQYLNFLGRKAQNQETTTGFCFLATIIFWDKPSMQIQKV